jgi:hypothetical protein
MEADVAAMHIRAGLAYGRDSTCGRQDKPKVDYDSEATAVKAAAVMSVKYGRAMEAYPCGWCSGWHIGRAMTEEEIGTFLIGEGEDGNGKVQHPDGGAEGAVGVQG